MKTIPHPGFYALTRLILASLLAAFFLAGCGPTPGKVVENFYARLQAHDIAGAKHYTTAEFGEALNTYDEMIARMGINPFERINGVFTSENFVTEIQGETARVWHKDAAYLVHVLVKEKGYWKIDRFDVNFAALGDLLQSLPENMRPQMPQQGMPGR